jgi:accessory gene regulator B
MIKINVIDRLSRQTAEVIANNITNTERLSKRRSQLLHREYRLLTQEELIEIFQYGFRGFYGDSSKFVIILAIGYLLNIFIPIVFVTLMFMSLRAIAGGLHMNSYMKCLIVTIIWLTVPTYIVNKIAIIHTFNNIELGFIIIINYTVCYILAHKYAPKDNDSKPIDNLDKEKMLKKKTKIYLGIMVVLNLAIVHIVSDPMIILSICLGQLIEIYTLTPLSLLFWNRLKV